MRRVIKIRTFGGEGKYLFIEEYGGFRIYQKITSIGYLLSQEWLITNDEKDIKLLIDSGNNICKEELLDMIDDYNDNGKFGVRAISFYGVTHMHSGIKSEGEYEI